MNFSEMAYSAADQIIAAANKLCFDYSKARDAIAEHFDSIVFNGNYDSHLDLDEFDLPTMRVMQEDEYDQSMSEDEKPDWDDIDFMISGYYIIL